MTQSEQESQKAEKRSMQRRHLVFYLRVFDGMSNEILGHLADISTRGIMLVSEKPIKPGRDFRLRLKLPKEVSGRDEILLDAVSCWSKQDSNPDFHLTGFEIAGLEADLEKQMHVLIRDFSLEESAATNNSDMPACNLTHTTGR
jgi:hypothetical protein